VQRLTLRASNRQLVLILAALAVSAVALAVFGFSRPADASSHREAPFISGDQQADATDVYAFRSPDRPNTVTLIANYLPAEEAAAGPNFYKFGKDVLYEINIDNDADARDDLSFQFRFKDRINNGNTFLYNTGPVTSLKDPDLNQEQFYSVSMLEAGDHNDPMREGKVLASNLQVAPANVGPVSFPDNVYRKVADQARYDIGGGIRVFAGPRDDPFFADLGGIFDLLQGIEGEDYLAGLNVHTVAIQVPIDKLTKGDPTIGVRTTSYRKTMNVLRPIGQPNSQLTTPESSSGPWVQLSRLDMPLVNELVIPLKDKNRWNGSKPAFDGQFGKYVLDPEPARLIDAILLPNDDVPDPPRNDLAAIFLTGIQDLNKPNGVVPSSQLRLNTAIAPSDTPSRLGILGGDRAGFPNGRRPVDDVVDIELRALAGGTPLTPDFNHPPNNQLGDGVDSNDVALRTSFPYLADPQSYADTD
jgi:Domain of unknown function (DUF4331)